MPRPNPNIPLSVEQPNFSSMLTQLNNNMMADRTTVSNLQTDKLRREGAQQTIDMNNAAIQKATREAKAKDLLLLARGLPSVLESGDDADVGIALTDLNRLTEELGGDTSGLVENLTYLAMNDRPAAAQFVKDKIYPVLEQLDPIFSPTYTSDIDSAQVLRESPLDVGNPSVSTLQGARQPRTPAEPARYSQFTRLDNGQTQAFDVNKGEMVIIPQAYEVSPDSDDASKYSNFNIDQTTGITTALFKGQIVVVPADVTAQQARINIPREPNDNVIVRVPDETSPTGFRFVPRANAVNQPAPANSGGFTVTTTQDGVTTISVGQGTATVPSSSGAITPQEGREWRAVVNDSRDSLEQASSLLVSIQENPNAVGFRGQISEAAGILSNIPLIGSSLEEAVTQAVSNGSPQEIQAIRTELITQVSSQLSEITGEESGRFTEAERNIANQALSTLDMNSSAAQAITANKTLMRLNVLSLARGLENLGEAGLFDAQDNESMFAFGSQLMGLGFEYEEAVDIISRLVQRNTNPLLGSPPINNGAVE